MLRPVQLAESLVHRALEVLDSAADGEEGLISVSVPAVGLSLRSLPPLEPPYLFWTHPDKDDLLIGVGIAFQINTEGPRRFETLANEWRDLSWQNLDPDDTGCDPMAFLGCAFDPNEPMRGIWAGFPNAGVFVPTLTMRQNGGDALLTYTARADQSRDVTAAEWARITHYLVDAIALAVAPAGSRTRLTRVAVAPEAGEWRQLVARAVEAIRAGRLTKVVPVRRLRVCAERHLAPARLALTLRHLYPSCTVFAAHLGGRCLIGATPERLVGIQGSRLTSEAIAGTERRAANDRQDRELGEALLASTKARHEHALVAEAVREALAPLCHRFTMQAIPELIKLRNLQHLRTPVSGDLRRGTTLLDVAKRLHPTPAVGGVPQADALCWLARHNPTQRGWYTGTVGWITPGGGGKLAVTLRCALLEDECADLFAGAGIVADSDPQAELEETELKFTAILEALENA
ncbi:isochorismate synthase [Thiohalomonas denitrificans]|uniref:isochorismate synthase n=1 Tax=Thiohalomonas denitrificans TaxID=415747 RepID=UPI0026F132E3|nr:isochorismate synthase [Thiohalomonas denitrificans]